MSHKTNKELYQKWIEDEELEDKLILIEGWARDGMTDPMIAKRLGIGINTFYKYKKKYKAFRTAMRRGKEVIDYSVENALLREAMNGDTKAQIFWLKNRNRTKWQDNYRQEMKVDMEQRVVIVNDISELIEDEDD